jgi:hypothetical protein
MSDVSDQDEKPARSGTQKQARRGVARPARGGGLPTSLTGAPDRLPRHGRRVVGRLQSPTLGLLADEPVSQAALPDGLLRPAELVKLAGLGARELNLPGCGIKTSDRSDPQWPTPWAQARRRLNRYL